MSSNFKEWWQKVLSQDRPTLYRLIGVGLLGVVLVTVGGFGIPSPSPPHRSTGNVTTPLMAQETLVGQQLTHILEAVPGAGPLSVAVTLKRSIRSEYVQQTGSTAGGGSPAIVDTNQGGQAVVPLDQVGPSIAGVVVVANNAKNPLIRSELAQAVQTLLQIQPYQVLVLPNQ